MKNLNQNILFVFNGIGHRFLRSKKMLITICCLTFFLLNGCKKLIEIDPPNNQLLGSEVFKDSANVQATLSGAYGKLAISGIVSSYRFSISTLGGFSADEMQYVGTNFDEFSTNSLMSNNGNVNEIWDSSYSAIYVANSIIEGVSSTTGLSERFKKQAIAEAKFLRSFCYFYLTNFFGDVPLILTTDVAKNKVMSRTPASTVYQQLITDLNEIRTALPTDYSISANSRTRANKWVVTALLARIQLYVGNWREAELESNAIITNTALFTLSADLTKVFTPTSKEAIWQFYNDANGYPTYAGTVLPNPITNIPTYALTTQLVDSFEPGDQRKSAWIGKINYSGSDYYYPYKYTSLIQGANTEYYTPMRLAEQYLIRAEARIQLDKIAAGIEDLNTLRQRSRTLPTTSVPTPLADLPINVSKPEALLFVERERKFELFSEWGHRWLDLKRTSRANAVLGGVKPNTWKPTAVLYPIPSSQIILNTNLTQNPGY